MTEGTTIGFWLPLPRDEANAALDEFRRIAADLGYLTEKGARPGEGHPGKLLLAIARGECIVSKKGE